ncbi:MULTISPECIES: GNAT family N-acetyltransferase [Alicyclobacillus]|uniref:GNAT family N-acetyltransferase n=1 Tax=Alicyclobacillus acidoterrestris (strain ATCC 49025 / DSM 3922 / CIP 106132 / NCIMB 13137 / GD3B) TaxID=1356854 RepID=T0BAM2_ALIAG|nr:MULTISPECIES: GNAT family protein [Alicyclobacillus]EPZ41043.1 hypothetical protein N007_17610 [Alicyclobacillus acidoterrestris ATCC 49025]UNO47794.1 GNAT family N-acetyltransferase [Alicyclobacillus acidoterrestris]GEO27202.1 ribosomal-protein-serine acetyltransferase [Alicyclobacillus acidoterrestris]
MFCLRVDDEIQLKLLEIRDAEKMYALTDHSRTYLREWLPWVDATTSVADTLAFIESTLRQFASNQGFQAGVLYHGELVGAIGCHGVNWANRSASIGYWLSHDKQGKGIMTRACRAVTDTLFKEYGLHRVEIRAAVENRKSRAIPERIGFVQEGICRDVEWVDNRYVDHVVYVMLEREWITSESTT